MPFILDKKLPQEAKKKLSTFDSIIEFESDGIVEDYLSGHPDLFFCKIGDKIIAAPNTPEKYINLISKHCDIITGEKFVGKNYPDCAIYNAAVLENLVVHKLAITDNSIKEFSPDIKFINVNQGMTRCSLLLLPDNKFITSDKGIYNTLLYLRWRGIYFEPTDILLPGMNYGLFGGCTGVFKNKILFTGSLHHHKDGKNAKEFLQQNNFEFIELYGEPLFDAGSIIHI